MKRLTVLLLAIVLLLGSIPAGYAETYYKQTDRNRSGEWYYSVRWDGTASIDGYAGTSGSISIPNRLDGKKVTAIGDNAFVGNRQLTKVIIPEGITTIGNSAFMETGLTAINLPNSIQWIGDFAFANTYANQITVPYSVKYMGANPFAGTPCQLKTAAGHPYFEVKDGALIDKQYRRLVAYDLTKRQSSYSVPEGVREIGSYAFFTSALTAIVLPESVQEVLGAAFQSCSSLTRVDIPQYTNLSEEQNAFGNDNSVVLNVERGSSAEWYAKHFNVKYRYYREMYTSGEWKYADLGNGTAELRSYSGNASTLEIPDRIGGLKVVSIGRELCGYGNKIRKVFIPASISNIEGNPFANCTAEFEVSVQNKDIIVTDGVLFNKTQRKLISYPAASTKIKYAVPNWIAEIADDAFAYCTNLVQVTVPTGVTSIGDRAFYGCNNLQAITMANSVTWIGKHAFEFCSGLKQVALPKDLARVSVGMFSCCSGLTQVLLPKNLVSIGDNAFDSCELLTEMLLPLNVMFIGESVFKDCGSLKKVTIPNSVVSIGGTAFVACYSLTKVSVPGSVREIGYLAFEPYVVLGVKQGSAAEQFCIRNNHPYQYE